LTNSFSAEILLPKNYKAKQLLDKSSAKHFGMKKLFLKYCEIDTSSKSCKKISSSFPNFCCYDSVFVAHRKKSLIIKWPSLTAKNRNILHYQRKA